jgi:hypothetical protein
MYKAMSGSNEGQWRDGVFSQAAPLQDYQASLSEFADGTLGSSLSRPRPSLRYRTRPKAYKRPVAGFGRTFLPAFTPQQMRGLGFGQAYHDGSLGDDVTVSIPGVTATPAPAPAWKPDLASIGIGVMAGALLFYVVKL